MIQKKAQEYCSLRHFIISYTVKSAWSLERNLTFNQGTRKIFGALRSLGEGFWKFVGTSGKILHAPTKPCLLAPPPPPGGAPPRGTTRYPFIYHI